MHDSKREERSGSGGEKDQANQKADSDATSKETVSDLAVTDDAVGSSSSKPDPGPSPDGALDESDEIKDAGPM